MLTNRSALRRALAAAALTAALGVAGCGGDPADKTASADTTASATPTGTAASPAPTASVRETAFNDADIMFAQMMIPHHRQAIEIADLAASRAADPEVKDLAGRIKAAQGPEIDKMTGWLTAWAQPTTPPTGHDMASMDGMVAKKDMADLRAAKGADFDRMFARLMIAHHEGAIRMAKTEQIDGRNTDARELAERIAADQTAEVQVLQKLFDRL